MLHLWSSVSYLFSACHTHDLQLELRQALWNTLLQRSISEKCNLPLKLVLLELRHVMWISILLKGSISEKCNLSQKSVLLELRQVLWSTPLLRSISEKCNLPLTLVLLENHTGIKYSLGLNNLIARCQCNCTRHIW